MSTYFSEVYDAFLARITADDWMLEADADIVERDWQQLLDIAIFRFKFPRVDLTKEELSPEEDDPHERWGFVHTLNQDEIQMLALYMKHEWIKRCISNWENIGGLYSDKNFSVANYLDKLNKLQEAVALEIHQAEGIYDRSRDKKPANKFKMLAGKKNVG